VTDRPADRMTLDEAAAVLGISREAVRLRIRRGTLAGERLGGVWYVSLVGRTPTDQATNQPTDRPDRPRLSRRRENAARGELLEHLEAENAWLRARVEFYERQVEHQAGEIAELRRQLPPPQGVGERPAPATPSTMPRAAPERPGARRKRRGWLDRLLGR
jgi:hypothetical protein